MSDDDSVIGSPYVSDVSMPNTPMEPFEIKYRIKISDPIKDGDLLKYNVHTVVKSSGKEFNVIRTFEDFEWLHHCLMTQNDTTGIVVPPLPNKPLIEAKHVEKRSQKQLGSASKQLLPDDFSKDIRALEKFLRLMISHPLFGLDPMLHSYLTEPDPPLRTKIKPSIFEKFSQRLDAAKNNHKDIDDYFESERSKALNVALLVKGASTNFNKTVDSQRRISALYGHIGTDLRTVSGHIEDTSSSSKKCLIKMAEALEDAKHGCEVDCVNDDRTLGFQLDLAQRYSEALKEMLARRTRLLIGYEDANIMLAKVKPQKRQEAEEHKRIAEQLFEDCSETARREIPSFHRHQMVLMQEALCLYAEAKIKTSRDTYALLAKSLSAIKQMPL